MVVANAAQAKSCCGSGQPALSEQAVASFKTSPQLLLTQNPTGGGEMVSRIRDLLLSDSATLPIVLGLLSTANDDQKSAIAAGLAQAARLWVREDPAFAQQIQQAVADTKDSAFILAYNNAAGNQPIGAGAGGGSPGGPGGQTNALSGGGGFGTGGPEGINGNGVNTGAFSMTGGTAGSGSVSP
jgi:hypothetical protein